MQDYTAIAIVLIAAAFLARRGWQTLAKRRAGCGSCGNCPSNAAGNTANNLVSISPIVSHAKAPRREEAVN